MIVCYRLCVERCSRLMLRVLVAAAEEDELIRSHSNDQLKVINRFLHVSDLFETLSVLLQEHKSNQFLLLLRFIFSWKLFFPSIDPSQVFKVSQKAICANNLHFRCSLCSDSSDIINLFPVGRTENKSSDTICWHRWCNKLNGVLRFAINYNPHNIRSVWLLYSFCA